MKEREATQLQAKLMEKDRRQDTINPHRFTMEILKSREIQKECSEKARKSAMH